MLFPFHKYLGPGNSVIPINRPCDEDDFIALKHDIEYFFHKTDSKAIRYADINAIIEFYSDFVNNSNWHSLLGLYGLLGKYLGETFIGVQYPVAGMLNSNTNNANSPWK